MKESHKEFVEKKFNKIVSRYDLVNSLLSFFQDHLWRRSLANFFRDTPGPYLDLCCGPFTLSFEILKKNPQTLYALDLSLNMLLYGRRKINPLQRFIFPIRGDSERLPFKEQSVQAISIAFGFRNLPNREEALREFYRVLKQGGLLAILEFSMPSNRVIKPLYLIYLKYLVPLIGGALTGDKEAYQYLAESIQKFPTPKEVEAMAQRVGFLPLERKFFTFGVVCLYLFRKA